MEIPNLADWRRPRSMRPRYYILLDRHPSPARDLTEWTEWRCANCDASVVGRDRIGCLFVSTVFVGIDTNPGAQQPELWEMMTFRDDDFTSPVSVHRYTSLADAEAGHANAVLAAKVVEAVDKIAAENRGACDP